MSLISATQKEKIVFEYKSRYALYNVPQKKCVAICVNDNYEDHDKRPIYGLEVFDNPIEAVIRAAINCNHNVYRSINGEDVKIISEKWMKQVAENIRFEEELVAIDLNLDHIKIKNLDMLKFRQFYLLEEHKLVKKSLGVFQFDFSDYSKDWWEGRWTILDVNVIMPSFEERWTQLYNQIILEFAHSPLFDTLGPDVLQIAIDYIGQWIPPDFYRFQPGGKKTEKINLKDQRGRCFACGQMFGPRDKSKHGWDLCVDLSSCVPLPTDEDYNDPTRKRKFYDLEPSALVDKLPGFGKRRFSD